MHLNLVTRPPRVCLVFIRCYMRWQGENKEVPHFLLDFLRCFATDIKCAVVLLVGFELH